MRVFHLLTWRITLVCRLDLQTTIASPGSGLEKNPIRQQYNRNTRRAGDGSLAIHRLVCIPSRPPM